MSNHRRKRPRRGEQPTAPLELRRAERLRELLQELAHMNETLPVVVEGRRDEEALRTLGLQGEIIQYNRGTGVEEFCDALRREHPSVILLMDWDAPGEALQRSIGEGITGGWERNERYRRILKAMCQRDVSVVEGVPALLERLERDEIVWQQGRGNGSLIPEEEWLPDSEA